MKFSRRNKVVAVTAVGISLLLFVAATVIGSYLTAPVGAGKKVELFNCEKGAPLWKVARELEAHGFISSARMLVLYARLRGDDSRAQAGTYQFSDAMAPVEMLRMMVAGEIFTRKFAVPEGYSIYQLGEILEARGLMRRDAFLRQCTDRALLQELGIPARSVEGYLQPSTYSIPVGMEGAELIRMMVRQFDKVYNERFAAREKQSGMSRHAILTMASLIDKEARVATERPLIASVFHNRLKRRMRLQSDPTAVYGVRAFSGHMTKRDIQRRNPYNTYLIDGLPPGPIGNPGSDAIEAVLNPAATQYLYFVAKKDGTHYFSGSLAEHNRAVQKYLRSSAISPSGPGTRAESS